MELPPGGPNIRTTPSRYHGDESMNLDYVIYSLWIVFWLAWLVAGLSAKRAA